MSSHFPEIDPRSSAVALPTMAGGQLGEIGRWLSRLCERDPNIDFQFRVRDSAGAQREEHARDDLRPGYLWAGRP
jgi:hypothetical protein